MTTIAITGAGQGLGREVARCLAAAGHDVILLGRTPAKLHAVAAEIGERAVAIECDVAVPASVAAAFGRIADTFGRLDVLVNNAAVYAPFTVAEATDRQIADTLAIDLQGPILCTRAALPLMARGSRIINVSSESVRMRHAMLSLYQSAKAGLERFTDAMRDELRDRGILVTLVRAGQMFADDMQVPFGEEVRRRYMEESARRGLDFRGRGISHVRSVADVFRYLIALPADLTIAEVSLESVPLAPAEGSDLDSVR